MLEVPQIMDADAGYRKAFGQVRANRFHPLAQPRTELEQGWTVGRRHPFAWRGHHYYAVPFLQPRLAEGVDEAFIGGHETSKAFNQVVQQSDVMGPGREQGKVEDHPRAGDAQPQLEAIVIELFRGTMPIVCPWLETAVPATARVATDRQGQGGVRKIAEKKEQFSAPTASIFVPVRGAGSAGSSGVELGDETFYSPAEMSGREASANGTSEREDLHQPAAQTGQIL